MKCFRIDLRRKLVHYVDGELPSSAKLRLEAHLLDCSDCRYRIVQLKRGKRFIENAPIILPKRDVWSAIEAVIKDEAVAFDHSASIQKKRLLQRIYRQLPAFISGLTVAGLIFCTFFLLHRNLIISNEKETRLPINEMELQEFRAVTIDDIQQNTAPHIMAEGYVSEVKVQEDGDLTFKLVEEINHRDKFIFCEIINPIKLSAPTVGSRVRVYGISRYDAEPNHNWYEVHPVLNIEPIRY